MNRRISRQVLDCGDGVREVTALALALKIPQLAADIAATTQSGDSEDSVAAVQDARAPTRFGLGLWSQCAPTMRVIYSFLLMLCVACLTACGKTDRAPSPELATNGTVEVTAKLTEIRGEFPPNKLYDYVFVMKYHVLKVHRGTVESDDLFVGHYNPLKPRATAQDKFSGKLGGDVERFEVGDVHRLALEGPLDQIFMGGIIDKHIEEKGTRYRAIWTDRARE